MKCRWIVAVFMVVALLVTMAVGYMGQESRAEVEPTPTWYVPTLPARMQRHEFIGWTGQAVAERLAEDLVAAGEASGQVDVVAAVDIYAEEQGGLGIDPGLVAHGSEPDVAMVLSGTFRVWFPHEGEVEAPYYLLVADRETGSGYRMTLSEDLRGLLAKLPRSNR